MVDFLQCTVPCRWVSSWFIYSFIFVIQSLSFFLKMKHFQPCCLCHYFSPPFQGQSRPSGSSPTTSIQTRTTTRAPSPARLCPCARSFNSHLFLSYCFFSHRASSSHHLRLVPQDNVVCLSPRLAQSLGNMGQVCVCVRVTSTIHLIDPNTLQSEYGSSLKTFIAVFSEGLTCTVLYRCTDSST